MITDYVWRKAKKIIEKDEIHFCADSTPRHWHFVVKNNKKATDVFFYLDPKTDKWLYSCCAVDVKSGMTCSFHPRSETPFCSHSLAVRLFIKRIRRERY